VLTDYSGKVVSQDEPFMKNSTYWGYTVRVADSLDSVFKESPYEGGYDFKLGISNKGNIVDFEDFKTWEGFKHGLVFFGGLGGIEALVEFDEQSEIKISDVHTLFDLCLNTCPE
jgi:predicted SPOUT superfamily RNA methylase MTH1